MTERTRWLDLSERCENATGPDRAIDAEIEAALTGRVTHKDAVGWTMKPQDDEWKLRQIANSPYISSFKRPAPGYTASLDAITALTKQELPATRVHLSFGDGLSSAAISRGYGARRTWPCGCVERADYEIALALCAAFCCAMAEKTEAAR